MPGDPVETDPAPAVESNHAWCGQCLQHPVTVVPRSGAVHLRCETCGWEEVYQEV